jgi:uncharacterized protein (DUF305 family)
MILTLTREEGVSMNSYWRPALLVIASLLLTVVLAACGDTPTSTSAPVATTGATGAATTMGNMPGMSMTTTAAPTAATVTTSAVSTTAATATTAAVATTAAPTTGNMPGMSMTTPAGTTATGATTMAAAMPAMAMPTPGNDPMTTMLKSLSGTAFEVNWMQQMIMHHQDAITMAKLVPTNTKRPELVTLANEIITAQNGEIEQMTKWLKDWHNAKPLDNMMNMPGHNMPGMGSGSMSMGMADMDKLKTAKDAEFDKLFIAGMIEHHQQANSMSALLPSKTQRAELLKLGQDIIKAQSAEIQQMQDWQKAWFK